MLVLVRIMQYIIVNIVNATKGREKGMARNDLATIIEHKPYKKYEAIKLQLKELFEELNIRQIEKIQTYIKDDIKSYLEERR